jgi:ankyrin repeat protein
MRKSLRSILKIISVIVVSLLVLFFFYDNRTKQIEALIDAAMKGNIKDMQLLVENGVNPYGIAYDGLTPIVAAARRHQYESINYLMSIGVDINKGDENHFTSLSYAVLQNDELMYDFLVHKGAKLNFQDQRDESYVLAQVKISKNQQLFEKVLAQLHKENYVPKD